MKSLRIGIPVMATLLLCGCFQVQDELSLLPDGSGTVTLTLSSSLPEELVGMMGMSSPFGGGNAPDYPPLNEAQAQRFFPPKDFTVKVEEKTEGEARTLKVAAAFKDVNALLASPYGRAHQLALSTNASGGLKLQALSGGSRLAQAAQFKAEGDMADFEVPGMEDAAKKKGEMRFSFRVVLPNAVTEANGARDQKAVTWAVERAKCKDDDEFASQLGGTLEATCSAAGIQFSPRTPPRLGLLPFSQLAAGQSPATIALPDTNRVAAAARFVPYALQVTRALDLSGEGSGEASQAQLIGAIVVPPELAPQRWGEPKLEEATDAKGHSLMPKEQGDASPRMTRFSGYDPSDEMDEGDEEDPAPRKSPADKPHMVTFSFKAPEWKVKEIAKIRGSLDLQYLGGAEVIKLSNAVPAGLVMDMSKRSSFRYNSDSDRGQITDRRLTELGLGVRVQMAMVQNGTTTVSLETTGGKAALVDAQVFDATGRPWPTTLAQSGGSGGESQTCQVMVAGKPKPPFSLALAVGGVGASVSVPILVEHVLVGDQPK